MIVKKKRGVREQVKKRKKKRREIKRYYVTLNLNEEGSALLDAILECENVIFIAAVILSAVANGTFASSISWQMIAPALVMPLSNVFSITGSFLRKLLPIGSDLPEARSNSL